MVSRQESCASEPGKQILNALPDAPLVTERTNGEAFAHASWSSRAAIKAKDLAQGKSGKTASYLTFIESPVSTMSQRAAASFGTARTRGCRQHRRPSSAYQEVRQDHYQRVAGRAPVVSAPRSSGSSRRQWPSEGDDMSQVRFIIASAVIAVGGITAAACSGGGSSSKPPATTSQAPSQQGGQQSQSQTSNGVGAPASASYAMTARITSDPSGICTLASVLGPSGNSDVVTVANGQITLSFADSSISGPASDGSFSFDHTQASRNPGVPAANDHLEGTYDSNSLSGKLVVNQAGITCTAEFSGTVQPSGSSGS
jgi:hypothetical protein